MYKRRQSREVTVGNVKIGGNNPISIQSMTNTDTRDADATIEQIKKLESVGCDIVRVAIPDMTAAKNISKIKSQVNIPVIADIHFDYRLALEVIDQGIDGVRINPGNIGSIDRVKMVVEKCKEKNLKIRIGVNGGSLEKELLEKYGSATPEALVESAMNHVKILEELDFTNIVISLKSSDIYKTLEAYELISKKVDYPLHIGITESGSVKKGTIKSSIGVGALLLKGIGDTIRISLTGDPCEEVLVGKEILVGNEETVEKRTEHIGLHPCHFAAAHFSLCLTLLDALCNDWQLLQSFLYFGRCHFVLVHIEARQTYVGVGHVDRKDGI